MKKAASFFLTSAIAILISTAIIKAGSLFLGTKLNSSPHILFPFIKYRDLFLFAAALEIGVSFLLSLDKLGQFFKFGLVFWLSVAFLSYRLAFVFLKIEGPCGCLGNLTDWINVRPQSADRVMWCILLYLFFGSAFFLARDIKSHQAESDCNAI